MRAEAGPLLRIPRGNYQQFHAPEGRTTSVFRVKIQETMQAQKKVGNILPKTGPSPVLSFEGNCLA